MKKCKNFCRVKFMEEDYLDDICCLECEHLNECNYVCERVKLLNSIDECSYVREEM